MKLGSLFDGSGGFPLAGSLCGIKPVWAAEVEPYPIAVTRSRLPDMKHLGSVTDINGGEIEPVDIVTFGSPCQDLSVAGKRAGLKHEANGDEETTRSGLFMEAVRIIKEMREATNGEYPTFALWENVPGAFSSNGGEDFRTVLEELIKIVEPSAVMPAVPKGGWPYADSYCGDGWSLAYRVFDAQYWGVPQRRRRIHLVLDLRGERAGKVSFEREGVRGYFETGRTPWQGTAGDASDCTGADDCEGTGIGLDLYNLAVSGDVAVSLTANTGTSCTHSGPTVAIPYTLKIRSGCEGGGKGALIQEDMSATLATNNDQYLQPVATFQNTGPGWWNESGVGTTLRTPCGGDSTLANVVVEAAGFKAGQGAHARSIGWENEKCPTLAAEACGNSVPSVCIKECLPFDTTQVTSPQNGCNPKWGDPCHPLAAHGHPPTVICKCYDARGNGDGQTVSTLTGDHENRITDYTSVVCMETKQGGAEIMENLCQTITASAGMSGNNQPVVCGPAAAFKTYQKVTGPLMANSHPGSYTGQDAFSDMLVAGVDCRNSTEYPEQTGTLQADCFKNLNSNGVIRVQYIVRRLTPTECARLQGFPDDWGHPDHKEDFTDEEYRFWLDVRNTHAAINGKPQKDYAKDQMLSWYNKLHTDSAEYKMWGNGIALPPALYIMQGMAQVMEDE